MEEDWDNLIILDACRYDMFKELNNIPGTLECKRSRGSRTREFLEENFKGKCYRDTVYVTGNPLVDYRVGDSFYKIVPVWKDGWNERYGTVLPNTMVKYTLKAEREHPNKRLIVHFVQPHYPFLDEESRRKIGDHADFTMAKYQALGDENAYHKTQPVWNLLKEGRVDRDTVWKAYKENLKIVLPHAKFLSQRLTGKTIITSDHGNLFGDRILPFLTREYGHPSGIYAKKLIEVPWLVIEKERRKKVIAKTKKDEYYQVDVEREKVKDRIRKLKESGKL